MAEDDGLQLQLGITLKQLTAQLARAEARMNKTAAKMEAEFNRSSGKATQKIAATAAASETMFARVAAKASTAGAALAGAFAGGALISGLTSVGFAAMSAVREVAALGDEAKRAGLSAAAFQEWKFVFAQNRIGIDQGIDGFKELALRADEFIHTGGGAGAEAFRRLRFSATELSTALKDPSALMLEIVDRLGDLDTAAQIRVADEIFGGSAGERFVELVQQGDDGLRRTIDRGRELGVVMDEEMIAKAQELDAKFAELQVRLSTMFKTAAIDLASNIGLVRTLNDEMGSRDRASALIGPGATDVFATGAADIGAYADEIDGLKFNFDQLLFAMNAFDQSTGGEIAFLMAEGHEALALALNDATSEMQAAVLAYKDGSISLDELEKRLLTGMAATEALTDELSLVDGVDMDSVTGAVGRLAETLATAFGIARALRALLPGNVDETGGIAGGTIGPSTRRGKRAPPSPYAPKKSIRPQLPSIDAFGPPLDGGGNKGVGKTPRDEHAEVMQRAQREIDALQERIALIGQESEASARLTAKNRLLTEAKRRGLDLDQVNVATGETLRAEIDRQSEAIGRLAQEYDLTSEKQEFMAGASATLKDGILDAAMAADNAGDFFSALADRIKRAALEALLFNEGPFGRTGGGSGLLGGLIGSAFNGIGKLLFNANGNAFSGGRVVPFATGGVVTGPTTFPMRGGTGLMGEAGPEAIMPLTRIGGKLGVAAAGGGGEIVVHVVPGSYFDARVETISGQVSARVVQAAGRAQARALPSMNDRIAARGLAT